MIGYTTLNSKFFLLFSPIFSVLLVFTQLLGFFAALWNHRYGGRRDGRGVLCFHTVAYCLTGIFTDAVEVAAWPTRDTPAVSPYVEAVRRFAGFEVVISENISVEGAGVYIAAGLA